MKDSMTGIANYAQKYHKKHPDEAVKIGFLPSSVWSVFAYAREFDLYFFLRRREFIIHGKEQFAKEIFAVNVID